MPGNFSQLESSLMPARLFDGLQAHRTSFIPIFECVASLLPFELFVVPFDEEVTSLNILQVQKVVAGYIQQQHPKSIFLMLSYRYCNIYLLYKREIN